MLASLVLEKSPGEKILHDPRLTWNTVDVVSRLGGSPIETKTGHAFIKERMRQEDAAYGGEMSSHHYFREFAYCDSGMIPWLLVAELLSTSGRKLSEFVAEAQSAYPSSGEINRRVPDAGKCFEIVRRKYEPQAKFFTEIDGVSFEFENWRFNLRSSNTEPVIRLNVESRGDVALMQEMTARILELVGGSA